jgi:hypothetical protein
LFNWTTSSKKELIDKYRNEQDRQSIEKIAEILNGFKEKIDSFFGSFKINTLKNDPKHAPKIKLNTSKSSLSFLIITYNII